MHEVWKWFSTNMHWLWSGVIPTAIAIVASILIARRQARQKEGMMQKSGNNSTNYQAGGNITIQKD